MAKVMKIFALLSTIITIIFFIIFKHYNINIFYTLMITFGTIAYHFLMRLAVGYIINFIYKNKVNYNRKWFKVKNFEMKIYKKLNVKKWKNKMPTYAPDTFDISKHSIEEILMTMCQAEIVHEIIFLFSFVPLSVISYFGAGWAFIITSILSAMFDLTFVIIQRFNRDRILRIKSKL